MLVTFYTKADDDGKQENIKLTGEASSALMGVVTGCKTTEELAQEPSFNENCLNHHEYVFETDDGIIPLKTSEADTLCEPYANAEGISPTEKTMILQGDGGEYVNFDVAVERLVALPDNNIRAVTWVCTADSGDVPSAAVALVSTDMDDVIYTSDLVNTLSGLNEGSVNINDAIGRHTVTDERTGDAINDAAVYSDDKYIQGTNIILHELDDFIVARLSSLNIPKDIKLDIYWSLGEMMNNGNEPDGLV